MVNIISWPEILCPNRIEVSPVPMTRSGGPTLAGIQESVMTDVGWWSISYNGLGLYDTATRRMFNAIRVTTGGRRGVLSIPVWSHDSAEWPSDSTFGRYFTTHSDGSPFSDSSRYSQPALGIVMAEAAAIGDTVVKLRVGIGPEELAGVRWSYNSALYENGLPTLVEDDVWTLPIFPAIRAPIPAGADLETSVPTCLVHLASDREMDGSFSSGHYDTKTVSFVEAHDYWSNIA